MHIYAFGSVCRGEIDPQSDIDLLAAVDSFDSRFDPAVFSIYSYRRLRDLWVEGNPFAWHLALESRLVFSSDGLDFINELGSPAAYSRARLDCDKFRSLFLGAVQGFETSAGSRVFELSTMFLAIRNIATCFSLGTCAQPTFGRHSARLLGPSSLDIEPAIYDAFVRARVLSTRGCGPALSDHDLARAASRFPIISDWMDTLVTRVHEP